MKALDKYVTAQVPELAVEMPPDTAEAPTQSFDNEDETGNITHEDLLVIKPSRSLLRSCSEDEQSVQDLRRGHRLHGDDDDNDGGDGGVDDYVLPSGESKGDVGHKQPTYGDLYDEQLMESNMRCYMQ